LKVLNVKISRKANRSAVITENVLTKDVFVSLVSQAKIVQFPNSIVVTPISHAIILTAVVIKKLANVFANLAGLILGVLCLAVKA